MNGLIALLLVVMGIVAFLIILIFTIKIIRQKIKESRDRLRCRLIAQQNDEVNTVLFSLRNDVNRLEAAVSQVLGTRNSQQDSFYISNNNVEFDLIKKSYIAVAVCDGMGGLSSGEAASQIAVECIMDNVEEYINSPTKKTIPEFLKETAIKANELVYNYGVETGTGMCGTTMVFAFLENNNLYWISIGDSRIYILRDGQIIQITNDHNYAYTLSQRVSQGIITEEQALREENREALISFIGIADLDIIDLSTNPFKLKKNDIVLLCSDGLTKIMSDNQICDFVNSCCENIQKIADGLTDAATEMCMGSQDNTTVAVVAYR